MKADQFELIVSRSHFKNWDFALEPSVLIDYRYTDEKYIIDFVAFSPETLLHLRPTAYLDILKEANEAVCERIKEGVEYNYMELLGRLGVTPKEKDYE